jgi:hypothetical protein
MGLPKIIVDGGLAHRSFEVMSEVGPGGTWIPSGSPLVISSESASDTVAGKRVLQIVNPDGGGVKQENVAVARFLPALAGGLWGAQIWIKTGGSLTATVTVKIYNAQGTLIRNESTATVIDAPSWKSVSTTVVAVANSYKATVHYEFTGSGTVLCDLAAFGPVVVFDLPWSKYQASVAPLAQSSRSIEGVVNTQFLADVSRLSIATAPEDATVRGYMEDAHEYLMRGATFDAYPDVDSSDKVFVNYVRPGLPIEHVQGKGRELYMWGFDAEKQELAPGAFL